MNMCFKNILGNPTALQNCENSRKQLAEALSRDDEKILGLSGAIGSLNQEIKEKDEIIANLNEHIVTSSPDEVYWNTKYPKANISYEREETDGLYKIDVRNFVFYRDFNIPVVSGSSNDKKALNALVWVTDNITYTKDKTVYGFDEYWAMPWQTLKRKLGDCEDGSNLLHSIMLKSGVPYWKIRGTAGMTPLGGHAYVTYLVDDNSKWVCLDWCYYPNKKPVSQRVDYKEDKLYGDVWFSYNKDYAFSKGVKDTEVSSDNLLKFFNFKKGIQ